MSLSGKIEKDLKESLKSGDKNRLSILRMVKSAVKNKEIEKGDPLTDEDIQAVFRSFSKKAGESIEQFSRAGRDELAEKEKAELAVLQEYLPKQLGEEDIRKAVRDVIDETGAAGVKDMGRVMKAVMSKLKGQADGRLVNNLVKETLEA
jgi:uncharacterized protein YqeY